MVQIQGVADAHSQQGRASWTPGSSKENQQDGQGQTGHCLPSMHHSRTCATAAMPSSVLALISSRMAVSLGVKPMPRASNATTTWKRALVLSAYSGGRGGMHIAVKAGAAVFRSRDPCLHQNTYAVQLPRKAARHAHY